MEGFPLAAAGRLAAYARDHPETQISRDPRGRCYAWTPEQPDALTGELTHGDTADELLAKLRGAS